MTTIRLADGGEIIHIPGFVEKSRADDDFFLLQGLNTWEQKPISGGHMQPRLTAAYGSPGVTYRYSGTTNPAIAWVEPLIRIKTQIETIMGNYNYCLLNRYRNGRDSIGFHSDDERGLTGPIASISLGATRELIIRRKSTGQTKSFALAHGDLFIMAGAMQRGYQHGIMKTTEPTGERISLTFRQIVN